MGGSGGGGYFRRESPMDVREALRKEEQSTEDQIFETSVSKDIGDLLTDYNDRDVDAVRRALDQVKKALERDIEEGSISPVFGGSVRKHTYVDGISDVDSLLVLKSEKLATLSPAQVLDYFERQLQERFPKSGLTRDQMSVTAELEGVELQLLPAIRKDGALSIPSVDGKQWSKIRPDAFLAKLSEVNDNNGGKVVPVIKIVKGINDSFPDAQRLSGYHVESLAIDAFKDYPGPQNTKAMVEHFFDSAKERVLTPIRDKTGQSVHVDGYAGGKNSECRKAIAQNLDRISRRIKNANATHSRDKWIRILNQEAD
jgi:hypothetical protein